MPVSWSSSGGRLPDQFRVPVLAGGLDDIHFGSREYELWAASTQAKTANVLFSHGPGG